MRLEVLVVVVPTVPTVHLVGLVELVIGMACLPPLNWEVAVMEASSRAAADDRTSKLGTGNADN